MAKWGAMHSKIIDLSPGETRSENARLKCELGAPVGNISRTLQIRGEVGLKAKSSRGLCDLQLNTTSHNFTKYMMPFS